MDGAVPCPKCGATCAFRVSWPYRPDITALLDLVHSHKILELAEQMVIASIFLATVMETLFEVHLWDMLKRLGSDERVAMLLLEAYRGRDRRVYLYNQLSSRPLVEVLESAGLPHFSVA
jgi:hypothetical protein